jgi:hypothetical protein
VIGCGDVASIVLDLAIPDTRVDEETCALRDSEKASPRDPTR